jgi:molybdenum cofactor cytidylyltransferase
VAAALKLAAVVLAAGRSRRFGGDKRLAPVRGQPLIVHALDALNGFDFAQKIAVVRPDDPIEDLVRAHGVMPVVNRRADDGMGTSLACGIAALGAVDGAFIVLADMPDIPSALYAEMAARFAAGEADIVVPCHGGRDGHPVLFGARCFAELTKLDGDRGARGLVESRRYRLDTVAVDVSGILRDVDQPQDLN